LKAINERIKQKLIQKNTLATSPSSPSFLLSASPPISPSSSPDKIISDNTYKISSAISAPTLPVISPRRISKNIGKIKNSKNEVIIINEESEGGKRAVFF
jgi:hypothetical protein